MNFRYYIPFVIFFAFFLAEKVFLFPSLQRLTQNDTSYLYFNYKSELLDKMEKVYHEIQKEPVESRRKIFVILGSSRLLYFNYKDYSTNYPDWEFFNFSAPVTTSAYYDFMLQEILERGVKPDYILVEADPYQFNERSPVFAQSSLAYSFDLGYILSNFSLYTRDEVSGYLGRMMFAGFKYPPDFQQLVERIKDPENNRFLAAHDAMDRYQRENRGAGFNVIPRETWYERDYGRLEEIARRNKRWLYGNYELSERHTEFFQQLVKRIHDNGIKAVFIRPQVSRAMTRKIKEDNVLQEKLVLWEKMVRETTSQYGLEFLDMGAREDYYCNTFVDASHMAIDCYRPFISVVMNRYFAMK